LGYLIRFASERSLLFCLDTQENQGAKNGWELYAWTNRFVASPFESTGRSHGALLRPALQRVLSLFLLGALANRQWCQGHCFILLWILGWEFGWVCRITGFTGLETLFSQAMH
jgi:hypothetical protein